MKRLIVPLIACLCILPAGATDLSLVAGIAPSGNLKAETLKVDLDHFSLFGVRFEKDFAFLLGFENSLLFAKDVLTPVGHPGDSGVYTSSNLLLNLPVSDRAIPYLGVGLGVLYKFGDSFPDAGVAFHTNWGGGLKLKNLAGPAGVRFDYRHLRIHGVEGQGVTAHELSAALLLSF